MNEKLWTQSLKGDQRSFEILFYRCHQKLSIYTYRLPKGYSLTEELVRDVFIRIWHNRTDLAEVKKFDNDQIQLNPNLENNPNWY